MNEYVFCKHCGDIYHIKNFFFKNKDIDTDMCQGCLISNILSVKKKISEFCSICQTNTKCFSTLRCGHHFHRECLSDLEIKRCPLCSKWIDENDEEIEDEDEFDDE